MLANKNIFFPFIPAWIDVNVLGDLTYGSRLAVDQKWPVDLWTRQWVAAAYLGT